MHSMRIFQSRSMDNDSLQNSRFLGPNISVPRAPVTLESQLSQQPRKNPRHLPNRCRNLPQHNPHLVRHLPTYYIG